MRLAWAATLWPQETAIGAGVSISSGKTGPSLFDPAIFVPAAVFVQGETPVQRLW